MIKIKTDANTLYYFTNVKKAKCYAYLDTGMVIYNKHNDRTLKDIVYNISTNGLNCTIEIYDRNNYFVDVYLDGRLRESNSLTHINNCKDLDIHLGVELNCYNGEDYNFNVDEMLMVTATTGDPIKDNGDYNSFF